jgi:hypothetical protein
VRVALVTTWGTACGIAEHSAFLKQAVEAADPAISIEPITDLHPRAILEHGEADWDLVVLNYHAALHSQWTPAAIAELQTHAVPVMVIYHDTGVPCNDQCFNIVAAADAAVVHEPCQEFRGNPNVHYWRMGVPGWTGKWQYDRTADSWCGRRPILGSIGFPFPWKNYDQLASLTGDLGWALLLIAPGATTEQAERWRLINPHLQVITTFPSATQAVSMLASCDATAFLYTCQNAGQSASILMGIAARKPVLALAGCRQFRALFLDPLGRTAISWVESFTDFGMILSHLTPMGRIAPPIVALAEQESWARLGVKFADLWQRLVTP